VVGLPMLTSPANLAFWATLCNCWGVDGLDAVMADFKAAEAAGKPQLRQFCRAWNADLLQKVCVWLLVTNGSGGGGWSMGWGQLRACFSAQPFHSAALAGMALSGVGS